MKPPKPIKGGLLSRFDVTDQSLLDPVFLESLGYSGPPPPLEETSYVRMRNEAFFRLLPLAQKDLCPHLRDDGASAPAAKKAAERIALAIADLKTDRELNLNPSKDLEEIRRTLETLRKQLKSLPSGSRAELREWLSRRTMFGTFATLPSLMWRIESSLPDLIEHLPPVRIKKGAENHELNVLIRSSAIHWFDACEQWPSSTISPHGEATAPLFKFLAGHFELSAATWGRQLKSIKNTWLPGGLLSGPVDKPRRAKRPRPKSSGTKS